MARTARLHYPGGIFHLISRCMERTNLLDGDAEREKYMSLLKTSLSRTDATLLAWCVMSNHVHLVVQAGDEPLSRLMKSVHSGYAVWKNRRDDRVGPVFADRYRAVLVEREPNLLQLVRYVHLNPVRAGLVDEPVQSSWSSHRYYVGVLDPPPWLHTDLVLSCFSGEGNEAGAAFGEFVLEGIGEGRRPDLSGDKGVGLAREVRRAAGGGVQVSDVIVGSPEFVREVLAAVGADRDEAVEVSAAEDDQRRVPGLDELIAAACEALEVEERAFEEHPKARGPRLARQVVTWLWVKRFGGRQVDVSRHLNTARAQVARWFGNAVDNLEDLAPTIAQVEQMLPAQPPALSDSPRRVVSVSVNVPQD